MAKTVSIAGPYIGGAAAPALAHQPMAFVVTVASASTDAAATIQSISCYSAPAAGAAAADATVSQPVIETPNAPFGSTRPVLSAGGSLSYLFQAEFTTPRDPGISPNNPAGGVAPGQKAAEPYANITISAQVAFTDGTTITGALVVPVLTSVAPFPRPEGGEAFHQQGSNANLLAVFA